MTVRVGVSLIGPSGEDLTLLRAQDPAPHDKLPAQRPHDVVDPDSLDLRGLADPVFGPEGLRAQPLRDRPFRVDYFDAADRIDRGVQNRRLGRLSANRVEDTLVHLTEGLK